MQPVITEAQVCAALGDFINAVVPSLQVIRGQTNRVPEPLGNPEGTPPKPAGNYASMIPIGRQLIATNTDDFSADTGMTTVTAARQITVQTDFHGPSSSEASEAAAIMFRDPYGCAFLEPYNIAPLYCSEPRQAAFLNAEQQEEERWIVDFVLQSGLQLQVPQDSATSLDVGIISVEASYPP